MFSNRPKSHSNREAELGFDPRQKSKKTCVRSLVLGRLYAWKQPRAWMFGSEISAFIPRGAGGGLFLPTARCQVGSSLLS